MLKYGSGLLAEWLAVGNLFQPDNWTYAGNVDLLHKEGSKNECIKNSEISLLSLTSGILNERL